MHYNGEYSINTFQVLGFLNKFSYLCPNIKDKDMSEMEQVMEILNEADAHGLRYEVAISALKEIHSNPKLNIVEAYTSAFGEWIK